MLQTTKAMLFLLTCISQSAFSVGRSDQVDAIIVRLIGESVEIKCNIMSTPMWDFGEHANSTFTVIYSGRYVIKRLRDRFSFHYDTVNRTSRLYISPVTVNDVGLYRCINPVISSSPALVAQLNVLDVRSICSTRAADVSGLTMNENGVIVINCSVCYTGNLVDNTAIRCRNSLLDDQDFHQSVGSCSSYTKTFVADRRMLGSVFTCSVITQLRDTSYYNYTWSSSPVNVTYGPSSVAINTMNRTLFRDGDVLTCTSDSNPEPTYQWTALNTVQHGSVFTVDVCKLVDWKTHPSSTDASSIQVMCTAIGNGNHVVATTICINVSTSQRNVQLCADHEFSTNIFSTIIFIIVAAGVVFLAVIILVAVVLCYKLRESYRSSPTSDYDEIGLRSSVDCPRSTTTVALAHMPNSKVYENLKQDSLEPRQSPPVYSRLIGGTSTA